MPKVDGDPVRLDVTEASVIGQRFAPRTAEGQRFEDHGWGIWLNRLNLQLNWKKLTLGARLDSTVYWLRPEDRTMPAGRERVIERDGTTRYRDAIYPAKLFLTYATPGIEATAGDAYAQFGRGLVLSMRKIDDLGLDTTVRGAKVVLSKDPIALTVLAGFSNPSRVDEATGRALFVAKERAGEARGPQPVFSSDRIVGGELVAGRGLPVVLSTHAVRLTRCSPVKYDSAGRVVESFGADLAGTCNPDDTETFLASLPNGLGPVLNSEEVVVLGQSVEVPRMGGFGSLYVGGATMRWRHFDSAREKNNDGNAIYAAYAGTIGKVTNTFEVKSYRNYYPLAGGVDVTRASAFSNLVYSIPPTAEVITQDSAFGFFNTCVNGGRLRTDLRISDPLLVWAQGVYAYTMTEQARGGCDAMGRALPDSDKSSENRVWDGTLGVQLSWDANKSYLYASLGARDDRKANGEPFYSESRVEYTFSKWLGGPYSLEFIGRHRVRKEDTINLRGPGATPVPWVQGEHYTAVKIAPKWVVNQGFEYTTQAGEPTYYFNGGVLYRFTPESNVRVFAGQQRGGLRCVSGVCRIFPAYEGARIELTLRY